jgi:hypothetical protein
MPVIGFQRPRLFAGEALERDLACARRGALARGPVQPRGRFWQFLASRYFEELPNGSHREERPSNLF